MTLTIFFLPPSLFSISLFLSLAGQETFLHQAFVSFGGICCASIHSLVLLVLRFVSALSVHFCMRVLAVYSVDFPLPFSVRIIVSLYFILIFFWSEISVNSWGPVNCSSWSWMLLINLFFQRFVLDLRDWGLSLLILNKVLFNVNGALYILFGFCLGQISGLF